MRDGLESFKASKSKTHQRGPSNKGLQLFTFCKRFPKLIVEGVLTKGVARPLATSSSLY